MKTYTRDAEVESLTTGHLGESDGRFPGRKSSKSKGPEVRSAWQI